MEWFYAFKEGLSLIFPEFFSFFKKMLAVLVLYAISATIPFTIVVLIVWLLGAAGIDPKVASLVFKILATIGQIIPLSIYLSESEKQLKQTNEDAPELCFALCTAVIIWLWAL